MDFEDNVLEPKIWENLGDAYGHVSRLNQEEFTRRTRESQPYWRDHPAVETKPSAVVVAKSPNGEMVLCFFGDYVRRRPFPGCVVSTSKRYSVPVSKVVEYVSLRFMNPDLVRELSDIYHQDFKDSSESDLEFLERGYSPRDVLGEALYRILAYGEGTIPRRSALKSFESAPTDEPFKILCSLASEHVS